MESKHQKKPTTWLYVLKLKDDKYYVGTTTDLNTRFEAHWCGTAAAWTKKFPPVKVAAVYRDKSCFDEDAKVKELMSRFGMNEVRGGSYSFSVLTQEQISLLQKEINHANGNCIECGSKDHWVESCPNKKEKKKSKRLITQEQLDKQDKIVQEEIRRVEKERVKDEINLIDQKKVSCTRCGRNTHDRPDCYAKTHLKGFSLREPEIESEDDIEQKLQEVVIKEEMQIVKGRNRVLHKHEDITTVKAREIDDEEDPEITFIKWSLQEYGKKSESEIDVVGKVILSVLPKKIECLYFPSNSDPVFLHIVKAIQLVISEEFMNSQEESQKIFIAHKIPLLENFLKIKLGKTAEEVSGNALSSSLVDLTKKENGDTWGGCNIQ
jgi:predicted GIY-YIG superfamily endonuclease